MAITKQQLVAQNACLNQRVLFGKLFPQGKVPDIDSVVEYAAQFDWLWASANLLTPEGDQQFHRRYEQAKQQYEQQRQIAWGEYQQVPGQLSDPHKQQALDQYHLARTQMRHGLLVAQAKAFSDLWFQYAVALDRHE